MAEPDRTAVHVLISGRVQGVWFRGWTVKQAGRRGVDGWVRNRSDGRVEAVFAGSVEAVRAMLDDCKAGPPLARVADVTAEILDAPVAAGFHVRHSD